MTTLIDRVVFEKLPPNGVRLKKPIPILVHKSQNEFIGKISKCNIQIVGNSKEETILKLCEAAVLIFKEYSKYPVGKLGPTPFMQFNCLKHYLELTK